VPALNISILSYSHFFADEMLPILSSTLAAAACLGAAYTRYADSPPRDGKPQDSKPQTEVAKPPSDNVKIKAVYAQKELKEKFARYHSQQQCFGPELARETYEICTAIKKQYQEQSSGIEWTFSALRNLARSSTLDVGYDQLVKAGKDPEEIAYSALKNLGLDVGLENNGLVNTIEVWRAIKDSAPHVYPENITPEMVAVYKVQRHPPYIMEINDYKNLDVNAILMTEKNRHSEAASAAIKLQSYDEFRTTNDQKIKAAYIQKEFKEKFARYHSQQQCFGPELAREAFETAESIEKQTEVGAKHILRNITDLLANLLGYETGFNWSVTPRTHLESLAYGSILGINLHYGLENDDYYDTMKVWYVIRKSDRAPEVYPENITSEMVAAYKALGKAQSAIDNVDIDTILQARPSYMAPQRLNPFEGPPKNISVRV